MAGLGAVPLTSTYPGVRLERRPGALSFVTGDGTFGVEHIGRTRQGVLQCRQSREAETGEVSI
jgi:hypothetical protein